MAPSEYTKLTERYELFSTSGWARLHRHCREEEFNPVITLVAYTLTTHPVHVVLFAGVASPFLDAYANN